MLVSPGVSTKDRFLDGDLEILQPKLGYRAGTDPVFLAAAVPAVSGQSVLELGCGVGVASLCLGRRVPGLSLTGVEIQPEYTKMARQNALTNDIDLMVVRADLTDLPGQVTAKSFDHVIANPPYLVAGHGTAASDKGKETAFREETALGDWISVGLKRLKPGGYLTVIHLAERLPEILGLLAGRAGSTEVKPLCHRINRRAGRIILRTRKGSKGVFLLHAPLVLHEGEKHIGDQESFTKTAQDVLRRGKPLAFENNQ